MRIPISSHWTSLPPSCSDTPPQTASYLVLGSSVFHLQPGNVLPTAPGGLAVPCRWSNEHGCILNYSPFQYTSSYLSLLFNKPINHKMYYQDRRKDPVSCTVEYPKLFLIQTDQIMNTSVPLACN